MAAFLANKTVFNLYETKVKEHSAISSTIVTFCMFKQTVSLFSKRDGRGGWFQVRSPAPFPRHRLQRGLRKFFGIFRSVETFRDKLLLGKFAIIQSLVSHCSMDISL